MERCDIRVEVQTVSRGQQTDGPTLSSCYQNDDNRVGDNAYDDTDSYSNNCIPDRLFESLIHPAYKDNTNSEEDIESMAMSVMIAFQADKHTLDRRLEIQTRLRDQSEINVCNEISALNSIVCELKPLCEEGEKGELVARLEEQIEILHRSARYVSSVAEMFGAVQHEKRLFNAMEVISRHVENLKQNLVNEKLLHEQTRKLQSENKTHSPSLSLDPKRRASIAAVDQSHSSDSRLSSRKGSLIKRFASCKSNSFSEITLNLRKGESDSSLHALENHDNSDIDYISEAPINDCSDVCNCSNTNTQPSRDVDVDLYQRKRSLLDDTSSSQRKHHPMRYKFQKRSSFLAPRWFVRLADAWGWDHMGELANKVRYSAACALVVAAVAILSYSFIAPDKQGV